jgi:hypothetical protein
MKVKASSKPDELALAHVDIGLEDLGEGRARARVQPVSADHQVVAFHERLGIVDLGLEAKLDAEVTGAPLQQQEQPLAADAAETMPGRDRAHALVDDGDIVPVGEVFPDPGGAHRIVGREVVERLGRQHDAPAERVVGHVALEHRDLVRGIAALHRDGEVEAGGTGAENSDLHLSSP